MKVQTRRDSAWNSKTATFEEGLLGHLASTGAAFTPPG